MDTDNKKSETSKYHGHTRVQWIMAFLINLAPLTYGLQLGWMSPMTRVLQSDDSPAGRIMTDSEISLLAGIPSLAAVVGILTLLYAVDKFGRKWSCAVVAVLQLLCWIIKLCPTSYTSLLIARISCGLGAGGCFHVIPMYIRELSQDNIRGTLGSMGTLAQSVGILTMYILANYLDYNTVIYCVVGVPVLNLLFLYKTPESPPFLIKKRRYEEAIETVAFLRGLKVTDKEVLNEIDCIRTEHEYFNVLPNVSFCNIFKDKAWRRGFFIMVLVFTCHGLNGVFFIANYASTLLEYSQVNISPDIQALAIPVFIMVGSLITMALVDRCGRKSLVTSAYIISALAFSSLASLMSLNIYGYSSSGWLFVVGIILTIFCYGFGILPVPYIIVSELFNFQVRAKLMACLTAYAWFLAFFQIIIFSAITNHLGAYVSFFIFAAINLFGAIITITLLPETNGKTMNEIEEDLRKGK